MNKPSATATVCTSVGLPTIAFLIVACTSQSQQSHPPRLDPGHARPSSQHLAATSMHEDAPAATGTYGQTCAPDPQDMQGGCADGLLCLPFPGGYCAGICGDGISCGPGGVCVDSHRSGEGCLATCESDADCRADEGYRCDPVWKACTFPAALPLAPKAPACEPGPALGKLLFGPATQLSTPAGGSSSDQEVHAAVDAQGNVTAAYIARAGFMAPPALGIGTITPNGTVHGDRRMLDGQQSHFDPWMARDRHGRLYLAWMAFDGQEQGMRINLATSANGTDWTEPVAIHDAEADCPGDSPGCLDKPQMAIGPDVRKRKRDAIYVVYAAENGQRLVKSTDGGRTFSRSVPVSDYTYGDIEVDGKGRVHVVNSTVSPRSPLAFGDPQGRIEYVYSTDGGAHFSDPIVVSRPGESIPGMFVNPQVVPDHDRKTIYVVYPSGSADARWNIELAVSSDKGRTWTHHRVNDDAPCANHMLPAATLDPETGRVHIMWVENRNGAGQVAHTSCDTSGCAANQRVSDEPFAAYSFVRHASKWLGEYNALLLDQERRVLHAVWAQPVDEGGAARSRIFHAEALLP